MTNKPTLHSNDEVIDKTQSKKIKCVKKIINLIKKKNKIT